MNENAVADRIILEAARRGNYLWRNNSGALVDDRGRLVRYGLGSFTDKDVLASSDYIGPTPVIITPEMVGRVIGVFTAVETKAEGWVFNKNDKKELKQKNFIDIVNRAGGFAGFAQSIEDYKRIITI